MTFRWSRMQLKRSILRFRIWSRWTKMYFWANVNLIVCHVELSQILIILDSRHLCFHQRMFKYTIDRARMKTWWDNQMRQQIEIVLLIKIKQLIKESPRWVVIWEKEIREIVILNPKIYVHLAWRILTKSVKAL